MPVCLALSFGASLVGCAIIITCGELLGKIMTEKPPLVVDVRTQREYDRDHVSGTVHIPFTQPVPACKSLDIRRRIQSFSIASMAPAPASTESRCICQDMTTSILLRTI